MGNYLNDEVYAQNCEEYNEFFSKNMKYRGTEYDKKDEDMIAKYDINGHSLSN